MDTDNAKQLVAESGRRLLEEKLAARTWGNISCRTGEDSMVITPSGLGYDGMKPEDIVTMDMASGEWQGTRKPSSEKGIHISAYRTFPEAGFVIHTHQTYASAIGLAGFDTLALSSDEREKLGGIALAEYGLSSTKKLSRNVAAAFESGAHVVFMAHHGAVIVGKDRNEAFERALLLEEICLRECKGQPESAPEYDEALAENLTKSAKKEFGYAAYIASAPVLACTSEGTVLKAQLDDMAQMIGARLTVEQKSSVFEALRKYDIVLVPKAGAVCKAANEDDLSALCLLAEKSCICWLHTQALKEKAGLSAFDIWLMRTVYKLKYSKKISG